MKTSNGHVNRKKYLMNIRQRVKLDHFDYFKSTIVPDVNLGCPMAKSGYLKCIVGLLPPFLLITVRFKPDSRVRSVAHISKVVPSPKEIVSRDSKNTRFHPLRGLQFTYQFNKLSIVTIKLLRKWLITSFKLGCDEVKFTGNIALLNILSCWTQFEK